MALLFIGQSDVDPIHFLEESTQKEYDNFLFFKKKNRSLEEKNNRKEKRKAFWRNLGNNFEEGGGAEGFGRTLDNVVSLFKKNEPEIGDYTYALAPEQAPKEGASSTTLLVGGLVLLSFVGLGYLALKKKTT